MQLACKVLLVCKELKETKAILVYKVQKVILV